MTVRVALGEPVRVRKRDLSIEGDGDGDRYLKEDLAAFAPNVGDVFDHTTYEASKLTIVRRLADRGYFDADFTHRRVEVTRADHAADMGRLISTSPQSSHSVKPRRGACECEC